MQVPVRPLVTATGFPPELREILLLDGRKEGVQVD